MNSERFVAKKIREKSRECHNHKPQPFPDPKPKRKADFPHNLKRSSLATKIYYNMDILRQTACIVVNPISVDNFASLFSCATVGRAPDLTKASFSIFIRWSVPDNQYLRSGSSCSCLWFSCVLASDRH